MMSDNSLVFVFLLGVGAAGLTVAASARHEEARPPVIDMHVHSTTITPADLSKLDALNVRYIFLAGLAADLRTWATADPARYLPSLVFPCDKGRAYFVDRRCWEINTDFPDVAWVRRQVQDGRVKAFGELAPQVLGISPDDPMLEPFWKLAEEFDLPVGVHMGPGPPGAAYDSSPAKYKFPEFGMVKGDPLLLEPVLLRHKRLRLFVMHAGWPRLEAMTALLYAHPGVYVDVGALQAPFMVPRASYYRHLRGLVEAGFGKRIMFGSDFPNMLAPGIEAIMTADFLSAEQKADILCGNASRFLKLDQAICKP